MVIRMGEEYLGVYVNTCEDCYHIDVDDCGDCYCTHWNDLVDRKDHFCEVFVYHNNDDLFEI